jgi:phosphate transport system protein
VNSDPAPANPAVADPTMGRELRRDYHDRIAELRAKTLAIVRDAARATHDATAALLDEDTTAGKLIVIEAADTIGRVAEVEAEVLALLALQSPMARDLRVILASRDIAQIAQLCLGLCQTMAMRAGRAQDILSVELRGLVQEIGDTTAELLGQASGAWATLDQAQAEALIADALASRELQRRFIAALLGLRDVPVDAAVDLGLAVRAYERLTDHAVEIAGRVLFAVTGAPANQASMEAEA